MTAPTYSQMTHGGFEKDNYLEPSPYKEDGGHLIGKDPRKLSPELKDALPHDRGVMRAIRAKCIECCCGNAAEVRKCVAVECSLWPLRMSTNIFHGSAGKRIKPDSEGG